MPFKFATSAYEHDHSTMNAAIVTLVTLCCCLFAYYQWCFTFFARMGIPAPRPVMLFGNMLDNWQTPWMSLALKRQDTHGPIYGVYDGSNPRLVVGEPSVIRKIMITDFKHFTDRTTSRFEHPIEQRYILVQSGEQWVKWRKIVTPAFTPQKLKGMIPHVNSAVNNLIAEMEKQTIQIQSLDIKALSMNYALEVIAKTGLGIDVNLHQQSDPLVDAIKSYFTTTPLRLALGFILPRRMKQMIGFTMFDKRGLISAHDYISAVIRERRKHESSLLHDSTSIILAAQDIVTDEEIVSNIIALFVAGFDSLALHVAITCFLLAHHPVIQDRVFQEVYSVIKLDQQMISYTDAESMIFLEAVLNETLRLYPPSTSTERKVSKEYQMGSTCLPVGLDIFIPTFLLHRDERFHPDPDTFDPDRFMPDRIKQMDPVTFMPFGEGPRSCPGRRVAMLFAKLALARLVQGFRVFPTPGQPKELDISDTLEASLYVKPFRVSFSKRN
jgi:cytochrome P450 family 3 subfamily A